VEPIDKTNIRERQRLALQEGMSLVFKVRRHVPGRGNARGNARASGASNNRSHYDWQTVRERVASGNCVFSSVSRDLFFFFLFPLPLPAPSALFFFRRTT